MKLPKDTTGTTNFVVTFGELSQRWDLEAENKKIWMNKGTWTM